MAQPMRKRAYRRSSENCPTDPLRSAFGALTFGLSPRSDQRREWQERVRQLGVACSKQEPRNLRSRGLQVG